MYIINEFNDFKKLIKLEIKRRIMEYYNSGVRLKFIDDISSKFLEILYMNNNDIIDISNFEIYYYDKDIINILYAVKKNDIRYVQYEQKKLSIESLKYQLCECDYIDTIRSKSSIYTENEKYYRNLLKIREFIFNSNFVSDIIYFINNIYTEYVKNMIYSNSINLDYSYMILEKKNCHIFNVINSNNNINYILNLTDNNNYLPDIFIKNSLNTIDYFSKADDLFVIYINKFDNLSIDIKKKEENWINATITDKITNICFYNSTFKTDKSVEDILNVINSQIIIKK